MTCSRIDVIRHCNDVVCPLGRRYFLKKVVPSFEKQSARKLTDLANPLKILMKKFSLVSFSKNRLLHRYEVKTSEAYSQKFAAFFQFIW